MSESFSDASFMNSSLPANVHSHSVSSVTVTAGSRVMGMDSFQFHPQCACEPVKCYKLQVRGGARGVGGG